MTRVLLDLDYTTPFRGKPVLLDWVQALGVKPDGVRRIRVLDEDGTMNVEITELARDEKGRRFARDDRPVEAAPFTVPLAAEIPDQIAAVHGIPG